jgi:hypothetical protein
LFEKKNVVNYGAPQQQEPNLSRESLLSLRNEQLTKRFYNLYMASRRCSRCGDCEHDIRSCRYDATIISFDADDSTPAFSIPVYVERDFFVHQPTGRKTRNIYDCVSMRCVGFISDTESEPNSSYIESEIDGLHYYYFTNILKDLMCMDVSTISGMRHSFGNRGRQAIKYFDC